MQIGLFHSGTELSSESTASQVTRRETTKNNQETKLSAKTEATLNQCCTYGSLLDSLSNDGWNRR